MGKIPISEPYIAKNQRRYVSDCIDSNWISSSGKYIKKFEENFARFASSRHAISVCNGTCALHLALAALGVKDGDEVIVPDLTFVATANSVAYTGARPVFVDIKKEDWCMDASLIEEKITPRTKGIIPVHLYGNSCDMEKITRIAKKHDIFVIEDAAEAIGASYDGKQVGSIGDIGCFSFYGNKVITTGEGGICTTDNEELKQKMELLKDHGMSKDEKYYHPVIGFNYRMTNIQAAIGLAQLEDIDFILKQRDRVCRLYSELIKPIKGIELAVPNKRSRSACWLFSAMLNDKFPIDRNELISHLENDGLDSRPFFHPMHSLPSFREHKSYPISEMASKNGFNLPTFTRLKDKQIETICKSISSASKMN